MSTPVRRPVASLWIGEKLHYLNPHFPSKALISLS